MDDATRQFVRQRAKDLCEYCRLPQSATPFISFHTEHVIAQQHLGTDDIDNLALSCDRCNVYKGPNLSSIDPTTNEIAKLYHPRQDAWETHFQVNPDGTISGTTPTGRATVRLLMMNAPRRVRLRQEFLS